MASAEDHQQNVRQIGQAAAAADRQDRREAALDALEEGDAVEYDGEAWLLLEFQPDGRLVLEQWDALAIVEPHKVEKK